MFAVWFIVKGSKENCIYLHLHVYPLFFVDSCLIEFCNHMTSTYIYVNGGLVKRLTACLLGTTIRTQNLLKGFNFMADLDVLHSRTNPYQSSRLIPMQILINQKPV